MRHLQPVPRRRAAGLVRAVYDQAARDFGLVPEPLLLHSPDPELLLGSWAMLRECVLVGRVPRERKETVAATISRLNRCPFCVEAHTVMLDATGAAASARRLAAPGRRRPRLESPELEAHARWAEATRSPESGALHRPPFTPDEAPELLGTACAFHYVNRLATIFLGESVVPRLGRPVKRPILAATAWLLRRTVARTPEPGASLRLLPAGERPDRLPAGIGWARRRPEIAAAMALWHRATERAGAEALSEESRERITRRVGRWTGEPMPLGRDWVGETVGVLPPSAQPAARLALLAALEPHRVTDGEVRAILEAGGTERTVLGAAAWGSALATNRIGGWLAPGRAGRG